MALVKENLHVTLARAWEILEEESFPLGAESCPVQEAFGRILAGDVVSRRNVPHYNASAMDGYALSSRMTAGASQSTPLSFAPEDAVWVNTGGDLPPQFDCIAMVEDTSTDRETGMVILAKSLVAGENVRPLGEDVFCGQVIAREGDTVSPALASLLATAGVPEVNVLAVPKTLYIPTGDEIIPLEEWLPMDLPPSGKVGESNSLLVKGYFTRWGFPLDIAPCLPDDPAVLKQYLSEKAPLYDLLLVGAGSAKGERDHTFTVLEQIGRPLFRWLLMKPGRPASVSKAGKCTIINLPGFPMSNAVILWSLVFPALNLLQKGSFDRERAIPDALGAVGSGTASLLTGCSSSYGKEEWVRLKCVEINGEKRTYPLPSGASALWSLSESDGIALLPLEAAELPKGSSVSLWFLRQVPWERRILFQGSNDPAFERIATFVKQAGGELIARSVGSLGGLAALSRGECHVAACHLLNSETGEYNSSFIRELFKDNIENLVRRLVFYRQQGIMITRGNPKGILSAADLGRENVSIVNRQPGAGTRVLLDYLLRQEGISPGMVRGYENQSATHFDAGNKVLLGFADAAMGIKSVADALGLDFIPVTEEPYELVFPKSFEDHPGIRALLSALDDGGWRDMVDRMGGYRWPE